MTRKQKVKGALKSKTMWFNSLLLCCLPVFELLRESLNVFEYIHAYMPELQGYLPDNVYKVMGVVVVVGNVLLRLSTKSALEDK